MKMIKKVALTSLLFTLFISCDSKVDIEYSYKDVVIKRVDENGKTSLYYNEVTDNSPKIWVKYSGINDGFSGYLVFAENKEVYFLSGDGYFELSNIDSTKFIYKNIGAYERPELSENVYIIQNAIRYEKEKNKNSNSKVKVIYPNEG